MNLNSSFKAVLFDVDGTLFDTAPDIIAACNTTLQNFGFKTVPKEVLLPEVMNGMQAMLKVSLPLTHQHMAKKNAPMYNFFAKYYTEHAYTFTKPYPGIDKLISTLHTNGIHLAVTSNKYCSMIKALFQGFDFTKYFETITGGDSCQHSKPHPEPLLHTLKMLNLSPSDTLYCGDTQSDVEASFKAGCSSCAVQWGYGRFDEPLKYIPDFTVQNINDILNIVFSKK